MQDSETSANERARSLSSHFDAELIRPAAVVVDQLCIDDVQIPFSCKLELTLTQSIELTLHVKKLDEVRESSHDLPPGQRQATRTTQSLCSQDLCDVASCRSGNSRGGTASVRSFNTSVRSSRKVRGQTRPSTPASFPDNSMHFDNKTKHIYLGQWTRAHHRLTIGDHSHLKIKLQDAQSDSVLIDEMLPITSLARFQKSKFAICGNKTKLSLSLELQPCLRPRSIIIKGFTVPELATEKRFLASIQYYVECIIGPHCVRMDFTTADIAHTSIDPVTGESVLNHKTGPQRTILLERGCKALTFKLVRKHVLKADTVKGTGVLPLGSLSPERVTVHSLKLGSATLVALLGVGYPIE